MNKAELIDSLTEKLGTDRRTTTAVVEGFVDTVVRAVHKNESVTITGFGVFEKRKRAPRVARNPRTGETVKVRSTRVPAFRPGAQFKSIVAGKQKISPSGVAVKRGSGAPTTPAVSTSASGRAAPATRSTTAAKKTTAAKSTAAKKSTPAKKSTAAKSTAANKSAAAKKSSPAKKTTAAKTTAAKKSSPAKSTAAKKSTPAKKSTAAKTTAAKKTAAKKTPAKKTTARKR